jgi:hypothetical protein
MGKEVMGQEVQAPIMVLVEAVDQAALTEAMAITLT